jgi:hypothetical protein
MGSLERIVRDLVFWADSRAIGDVPPWSGARRMVDTLDRLKAHAAQANRRDVIPIPPQAVWENWTVEEILQREG